MYSLKKEKQKTKQILKDNKWYERRIDEIMEKEYPLGMGKEKKEELIRLYKLLEKTAGRKPS